MYYYSTGKENGYTKPTGTMVQIVGRELRKIGDWKTHSTKHLDELTDEDKYFVGWYWYNTSKEGSYSPEYETMIALGGKKAELYTQLDKLYRKDHEFFAVVMDKIGLDLETFGLEQARRTAPVLAKYAIFKTNDNGTAIGGAIAVGEAAETEDWMSDRHWAVVDGLAKLQKCAPDDITDLGWHTAQRLEGYLADAKNRLTDLENEINIMEKA